LNSSNADIAIHKIVDAIRELRQEIPDALNSAAQELQDANNTLTELRQLR